MLYIEGCCSVCCSVISFNSAFTYISKISWGRFLVKLFAMSFLECLTDFEPLFIGSKSWTFAGYLFMQLLGFLLHSSTYFISSSTRSSFSSWAPDSALPSSSTSSSLTSPPKKLCLYQKYHLGIHYLSLHGYLVLLHHLLVSQHCLVAKLLYQQR